MKTGIELISEERREQFEKHGHTIAADVASYSDDIDNDLVFAAAAYALPDSLVSTWQRQNIGHRSNLFPWSKDHWKPHPEDRIKELMKAGALIAAEIDRLLAIEFNQPKV